MNAPRSYIIRTLSVLYFNEITLMMTFQQVETCCQRECKELPTNKERETVPLVNTDVRLSFVIISAEHAC
jgi:hypothetical protein